MTIDLTFHGVRGTMPITDPAMAGIGGNTSCVSVRIGEQLIICDAGTGIVPLGKQMITENTECKQIDIVLSHTHIDHILGLMFFAPLYKEGYEITLWAGHLQPEYSLDEIVERLISPPLFPITRADFKAKFTCRDFMAGETLPISGFPDNPIQVTTHLLEHPDRATGYRIAQGKKSICYITDIEHLPDTLDGGLIEFIRNTDCLIYDSTYSDEEFEKYAGWGHSTWQQAARLAQAAKVEQLALFHHHPYINDTDLHAREKELKEILPSAILAKENMVLSI